MFPTLHEFNQCVSAHKLFFTKTRSNPDQAFFCRALALNKSSTLIQLTGFFLHYKRSFCQTSLTTTFKAATWMLARLWFKFCCQNFRPLLTKENAGIPSSATGRTATTELQRPQLSPPCSFCLLIAFTSLSTYSMFWSERTSYTVQQISYTNQICKNTSGIQAHFFAKIGALCG